MRPKTNETKKNVIDSSNLVSGPSYISYNSDAERIRGTGDDYDYEIMRQMKMIAVVM